MGPKSTKAKQPGVLHTLAFQIACDVHGGQLSIWHLWRSVRVVPMTGCRIVEGVVASIVQDLHVNTCLLY